MVTMIQNQAQDTGQHKKELCLQQSPNTVLVINYSAVVTITFTRSFSLPQTPDTLKSLGCLQTGRISAKQLSEEGHPNR